MTEYTIVDIPGWEQLHLDPASRPDVDRRIAELAHQSVPAEVPRDRATPFRGEVRRHLTELVDQAREAGAGLVSLPTSPVGEVAVAASYTVAEWRDPQPTDVADQELVAALAERSDALATVVDVDGQPALREELVEEDDPGGSASGLQPRRARRVSYTIAGPSEERTWVLFTFSTLGDGDPDGPLARVLVELFDAHIGTLRWVSDGGL
jgi:hypothetical protein